MTNNLELLKDFSVLSLRPNDILVVRVSRGSQSLRDFDEHMSWLADSLRSFIKKVKEDVGYEPRLLLMTDEVEVGVIRPEQGEEK
jgi:hypothetical protein